MGKSMTETAMALSIEIGERIRMLRQMRGLSQEKVATALGVTFQQIQKYERGSNRISVPTLIQMCEVLGAHPMEMIGDVRAADTERPNVLLQRLQLAEDKLSRMQKIIAER